MGNTQIEDEKLNREELLKKLHGIKFWAILTDLVSEYCLEVEIYTSKGTNYSWIDYDDWRISQVTPAASAKLLGVSDKLSAGILSKKDIEGTCFDGMTYGIDEKDINRLFFDFAEKNIKPGEEFYCFYDEGYGKYFFFNSVDEIAVALEEYYPVNTAWEEMNTEDLEACWNLYNEYDGEIPFGCFEEE